jgi:hypothetical protein
MMDWEKRRTFWKAQRVITVQPRNKDTTRTYTIFSSRTIIIIIIRIIPAPWRTHLSRRTKELLLVGTDQSSLLYIHVR